jgi:hypothetical protein
MLLRFISRRAIAPGIFCIQQGRQPEKKGCGSMKFSPKEARSLAEPQEAKEYRRLISKEMEDMTTKELQRLYWNILRKKG